MNQGFNKKKARGRKSTFITTKPKNEPAPTRKYLEKIFRNKEANFPGLVTPRKKILLIQHTMDPGIKLLMIESSLIYEICFLIR